MEAALCQTSMYLRGRLTDKKRNKYWGYFLQMYVPRVISPCRPAIADAADILFASMIDALSAWEWSFDAATCAIIIDFSVLAIIYICGGESVFYVVILGRPSLP